MGKRGKVFLIGVETDGGELHGRRRRRNGSENEKWSRVGRGKGKMGVYSEDEKWERFWWESKRETFWFWRLEVFDSKEFGNRRWKWKWKFWSEKKREIFCFWKARFLGFGSEVKLRWDLNFRGDFSFRLFGPIAMCQLSIQINKNLFSIIFFLMIVHSKLSLTVILGALNWSLELSLEWLSILKLVVGVVDGISNIWWCDIWWVMLCARMIDDMTRCVNMSNASLYVLVMLYHNYFSCT